MIRKTIKIKKVKNEDIGHAYKADYFKKTTTMWLLFIPIYSYYEITDLKIH